MAELKVRYETLHNASDKCDSTSKQLTEQTQQLQSNLNPLVTTWEGQAREQYFLLQKQWDQAHEELNMVLADISKTLRTIAEGYQNMERSQAGRFGG
jgi:early secretory antigenic target protein ESAT-6